MILDVKLNVVNALLTFSSLIQTDRVLLNHIKTDTDSSTKLVTLKSSQYINHDQVVTRHLS